MSRRGNIRYLFASGNTSEGYQSYLPGLLEGLERVYILKGAPGSGRSTFIRQTGLDISKLGYDAEFYVSPFNGTSLEGVVFPQLGMAVVDGSEPGPLEPRYPGVTGEIINLGDCWDKDEMQAHKEQIKSLVDTVAQGTEEAVERLREIKLAKEHLKRCWLSSLNLERLGVLVQELTREIIERQAGERHYYGSNLTSQGMVSYIDELSLDCRKRYILTGPPGSGKSTVLAAIGEKAREKGYRVEYYHSGLNPDSLDMVIIADLQVALIDNSNRNLSIRLSDIIINTEDYLDAPPDEEDSWEINEARRRLEGAFLQAVEVLKEVESCRKRLQRFYTRAMDFAEVDRTRARVIEEIRG